MAQDPSELDSLRRENEELRERLAKSTFETEMYRCAAYEMFDREAAGPPPTDEEIAAVMRSPSIRTLREVLDGFVPPEPN